MKERIKYIIFLSVLSTLMLNLPAKILNDLPDKYTLEVSSSFRISENSEQYDKVNEFSEIFTVKAGDHLYETNDGHWILNPDKKNPANEYSHILEISRTNDNKLILRSNGQTISGLCGSKMKIDSLLPDTGKSGFSYMIGFEKA